jgi:SagB-type dehydrogenase family enzyme
MADVQTRLTTLQVGAHELSFDELATILYFAHGVLSRRLCINWNSDARSLAVYDTYEQIEGRGTASGGGLYPTEVYLAAGASGPLLPGIYHYDNAHHALERLRMGDMTAHIQNALFSHPFALQTDQFLLISLDIWKNAFKYNNFSYHVITQDLGALLGSLRFLAAGLDAALQPIFWYQEEILAQLMGLDLAMESIFAVVPLPMVHCATSLTPDSRRQIWLADDDLVPVSSWQRSQKILTFDLNQKMHHATLITDEPRPERQEAYKASADEVLWGNEQILLPPSLADLAQVDLLETFERRKSSFGTFSSHKPLSIEELSTLLAFGAASSHYISDLKMPDGTPHFTRQFVFVNNVSDIECGVYAYDRQHHCLYPIYKDDFRFFLQQNYFLQNYNLAETGAVIVVAGKVEKMLEVYGNRGYRVLNAEVGMIAQGIYMASTALSCACGAALGFNNMAFNEALHLTRTGENALLLLMIGHERPLSGNFDYRLV